MQNARLDEAEAGLKIASKNINNLRYADDTILMAESELLWNQSVVPCPVLTVASWPAYRYLKRQVRWSGIAIS